jgi:hypothetical protein
MSCRLARTAMAGTLLMAGGCDRAQKSQAQYLERAAVNHVELRSPSALQGRSAAYARAGAVAGGGGYGVATTAYAAESRRFLATKHSLELIASASNLQKSWQAVIDYCGTISCEVWSSTITTETEQVMPAGHVSLRVEPSDLKRLLAYVEGRGRVAEHSTETEDKTGLVVDTEAKIKNFTAYRDSLRGMLARPGVTVKDAIDIQEQLSQVQSQLDSETAGRKALANETEKVEVEISFRVDVPVTSRHGFRQIWGAMRDSGSILAESTAWLIMAVMTLLPWVAVGGIFIWILVKWIRRRRALRLSGNSS